MAAEKTATKDIIKIEKSGGAVLLTPLADLTISNAAKYDTAAPAEKIAAGAEKAVIDISSVKFYDSFLVLFINGYEDFCKENGVAYELKGLSGEMKSFIKTVDKEALEIPDAIQQEHWLPTHIKQVGDTSIRLWKDGISFIEFFGALIIKILSLFIKPKNIRWKDFPYQYFRSGVSALPIVLLIVFLIGLVTGYQGAIQLKRFGADMFISSLVGLSITRELGPLMTAIIIAGRSGSSFAAELGTMKVSEEIDALSSMGFDYMGFLVAPRVLSVFLAMPFLTILADVAGILGGLVAALATLNTTLTGYLNGLNSALSHFDVLSGLGKSMVFGFLIATVGCFRGMQVRGGASSVGKYTTASVVTGIFLIIVVDAIFTFIFTALGI